MTAASRTLERLEAIACSGLSFEQYATEVAQALNASVPFDAFCVGLIDPATNLLTSSRKIGMDSVGDSTFLYWEYAQPDFAQYRELSARPMGVSILEHETNGDKAASGRFREVVSAEIGADHEMRGVTRVAGRMWGAYALYRASGSAAFNLAEADFLHRLETVLAQGFRATTIVSVAEQALQETEPGPAVLVFDHTGALVHATATAAERLEELGGPLRDELPVPVTAVVQALRGGGAPEASAHTRARSRSGRWYSLHAAPLAGGGDGGVGVRPLIAVTVEPATPPQILPLLVAAYGLTDREATIVQAMLRGETTHAIAQALFLSPYTVQDHFKSIFDKIGVSSRREVAARVFYGQYLGMPVPAN